MKNCFILFLLFIAFSCRKKVENDNAVIIGKLEVDLDANDYLIRTSEALIGNFVCDAIKSQLEEKNIFCDLVLFNSGGIRYNKEKRPNGIYLAGNFTSEMVDEMLPFTDNLLVKVKLTGVELKQILERSLAELPAEKGSFMQFSKGISIKVNINNPAQVLNTTVSPPVIVSEGERLVEVTLNDLTIIDDKEYNIITLDYIVNGNDGYVTFNAIPSNKKIFYNDIVVNLVRDYVTINSPIKPEMGGRINF
jgi:5'-nucleotidase / UDP-sugar diphosphatase